MTPRFLAYATEWMVMALAKKKTGGGVKICGRITEYLLGQTKFWWSAM